MTLLRVAGFCKLRNEIIREGNLYRVLAELDRLCDGGVICDDASTDGTTDVIEAWCRTRPSWFLLQVLPADQSWEREMTVKQSMLRILHSSVESYDWILWLDGDELLLDGPDDLRAGTNYFSPYLVDFCAWLKNVHDSECDVWTFHYTQPWRTLAHARIDGGFDDGWFWKLWRYRPDLKFDTKRPRLHAYQFPETYLDDVMAFVDHNWARRLEHKDRECRAARAPFEILHVGNVGSQLPLKAAQYRGTTLSEASLARHLYFGDEARYRRLDPIPSVLGLPAHEEEPVPFTDREQELISQMGSLRQTEGLMVVIVPTFDRGYILDRTLASVEAQTDEHWVCVVLDDGSTDETPALLRRWMDRDPRFFYCKYEENRGGVAMNEIGMALASEFGEFWVRLGSDDYFEPWKLAVDRAAFEAAGDVGALFGPYRDLHETFTGKELRNYPSDARGALFSKGFAASWANIAVRTVVLRAIEKRYSNFCDPRLRNMEDWLVNTRIACETPWAWRGLARDVTGATLHIGLRGPLTSDQLETVIHDAYWRIGADGASQKSALCADDSRITRECVDAELEEWVPKDREVWLTAQVHGWRQDDKGIWHR